MNKFNASAIILAGGKSSRMDGIDKSMLQINNITLIEHIINQISPYFKEIIICSNDINKHGFLKGKIVPDLVLNKGPLMGILSGLIWSNNEINFITACDIPEIPIKYIKKMMDKLGNFNMVVPIKNNKYEPLFAIYKKTPVIKYCKKAIKNDNRKISSIYKNTKVNFIKFDKKFKLHNINNLIEYNNYLNHIKIINDDNIENKSIY